MEHVMGLTTAVHNQPYSAERVHVVLNGLPVTVKVEVVNTMTDGRVHVKSEIKRLSGIDFTCSVEGRTLTIVANGPRSGSISVRNTGNATATGGGTANTGIMIGGSGKMLRGSGRVETPRADTFGLHDTPGEDVLTGGTNSKATLTLIVSLRGLRFVIS